MGGSIGGVSGGSVDPQYTPADHTPHVSVSDGGHEGGFGPAFDPSAPRSEAPAMDPYASSLAAGLDCPSEATPGYRLLEGNPDAGHVRDTTDNLRAKTGDSDWDGLNRALDALARTREADGAGEVPASDGDGIAAYPGEAGYTSEELNGVLSQVFAKERGAFTESAELRESLVERALANPALLQRITEEGTRENRLALAHATLADPRLDNAQATQLIETLQAGNPPLTWDDIVSSAPAAAMQGLARLAAQPINPNLGEVIAKNGSPETQMRLARAVLQNEALSPEDRTIALTNLMENTSQEGLNHLISNASSDNGGIDERQALSAVMAGSVPLQERVGRDLTPSNQQRVVDEVLRLPMPKASTGRALSIMMHSANMSPADKNALFDHLQNTGRVPAFLETQVYMPLEQGLLDGLNAENAAAASRGFEDLAREAETNPNVANPDLLGRSASASDARSRSEGHTDSSSRSHTDSSSSTHEVGVTVGAKAGVSIPLIGSGEVSVEGSYSYSHTSGESDTRSSGTSDSRSESYSQTYGESRDLGAGQRYDRDKRNWKRSNAFTRATHAVDQWVQQRPDTYRTSYRRERGEIYRS